MRFRAPADVFLRRAQVILILGAMVPTILTTALGIVLLATGSSSYTLITGILVLAFCASSLAGYILGSIFLRRGAALAQVQADFLSAVSHELRTPMTSMRMFVEALQDDRLTDPEERARCLYTLHRELSRLDRLVERLIELSRMESGSQPFDMSRVSIQEVIENAMAAFDMVKMADVGELDLDVTPGLYVRGDRSALTQLLVNLLTNAWKHGGDDRKIRLAAKGHGNREVEITVADNGPGVPVEERQRIFEKFERGSRAIKAGTSGSGLGLSVVKAIVKAHRGQVDLQSPPEGGACFRVLLPRSVA